MTLSFITGFIASIMFWLNNHQKNLAIITVHDSCDGHCAMLYGLIAAMQFQKDLMKPDFRRWERSLFDDLNKALYKPPQNQQIRSPIASSRTSCMEPFMTEPRHLRSSGSRQLRYLHTLLSQPVIDSILQMDYRVYRAKLMMIEGFIGPSESVVVEFYHLNNSALENGKFTAYEQHKKRKNRSTPSLLDPATPRGGDEWENIWWHTLSNYRKYHKQVFSRSKDQPASGAVSAHILGVYNSFKKSAKGRHRVRPILSTSGYITVNASHHDESQILADQSITAIPTSHSLSAELIGHHDNAHGASCQWDFTSQNLTLCGDVVIVIRQLQPLPESVLKSWACGALDYESVLAETTNQLHTPSKTANAELFSVTAIHTLHTGFLESECLNLNHRDFDFYSPAAGVHTAPSLLENIINPNFKTHLILNTVDEGRPTTTGGANTATTAAPQTAMARVGEVEESEFLSPFNRTGSPSSFKGSTVPPLDLTTLTQTNPPDTSTSRQNLDPDGSADLSVRKTKSSFTHTINPKRILGLGGDRSASSRQRTQALTNTQVTGSVSNRMKYAGSTFIDMEDWCTSCQWRLRNRKVQLDLRGDIHEFLSRHCVVPDLVNLQEWAQNNGDFTREEVILSCKCSDNTLAFTRIAESMFYQDTGSTIERLSSSKKDSKVQRSGLRAALGKLTFTKRPFKESSGSSNLKGGISLPGTAITRDFEHGGHKRSGSLDDIGRQIGSSLDQDRNRSFLCKSPPARLPSRKTELYCRTEEDDLLNLKSSAQRNALLADEELEAKSNPPETTLTARDVLLDNEDHPDATEQENCGGCITTKSSESGFQAPARQLPDERKAVIVEDKPPSPPKVLMGSPFDPPPIQPHLPTPPRQLQTSPQPDEVVLSVKKTNTEDLIQEEASKPSVTIREPTPAPRMSLPSGLMAELSNAKKATTRKTIESQSQAGATQTQPRLPTDLKTSLLSRATAPHINATAAPSPESKAPGLSSGLLDGIAGGMSNLRKTTGGAAKRPVRPREGSMPDLSGPASGLAAMLAKRGEVETAASTKEPVRKAPLGRKLFWKPLETTNLDETIFGELKEADSVMFAVDKDNLSKVFSKDAKKNAKKGTNADGKVAAITTVEDDGKKKVKIIDDRRAQNVGIVVLRLKTTPEELARQLLTMEFTEEPAADMLEKLETIFFTEEEEIKLETHLRVKSPEDLRDVPERRLLPFRRALLPRGRPRTKILGNDLKWPGWVMELTSSFDIIKEASQEMRSCVCFRAMLSAVLRWGNFVNYGSNELHIKAITLSSLLKLTEFKTTIDAKVTSLHYIVATLLASTEHMDDALALARMTDEMRSVRAAAKVTSEVLEGAWKQLQTAQELVRVEMTTYRAAYDSGDPNVSRGMSKLVEISERMRKDIENLETISHNTMALVQSTAKFFGDEEAAAAPAGAGRQFFVGSVFMTLDEFLRKFDDCIKDIIRRTALYASILTDDQTPQLVKFVTTYTGKALSKNAMMAIEANRDFNRLERTRFG